MADEAERAGGSVAAVEAVLAEHRLTWWAVYPWNGGHEVAPRCTCGVLWAAGDKDDLSTQTARWEAHQAEALAAANLLAAPAGNEAAADGLRALDDLSYDERVAVDRFMDDHMYHHRHVGPAYAMGCGVECRTDALAEAFRREVLVPRRAALAAHSAKAAADEESGRRCPPGLHRISECNTVPAEAAAAPDAGGSDG